MLEYHFGMNQIKEFRELQNLSQAQLGELCGTFGSQINRLENGERKLTVEWLNTLSEHLNCHPWELAWPESASKTTETPIVGYVGAGQKVIPYDDVSGSEHAETVEAPTSIGKVVAVIVKGDSMLPTYREGDIIFYRPHEGHPAPLIKKECVVRLKCGTTLVKILHKGSQKGLFTLYSYNAEPLIDQEIEWAGPVLWVRRDG